MIKDLFPISENKISKFLDELDDEKYKWNIATSSKLLHNYYCKYVFTKGKRKGYMCKRKSIALNNFCETHYLGHNKVHIYIKPRCPFLNKYNKHCSRNVKKEGDICPYHMKKILCTYLPEPDIKEMIHLGYPYHEIYDIFNISLDIFTYDIHNKENNFFHYSNNRIKLQIHPEILKNNLKKNCNTNINNNIISKNINCNNNEFINYNNNEREHDNIIYSKSDKHKIKNILKKYKINDLYILDETLEVLNDFKDITRKLGFENLGVVIRFLKIYNYYINKIKYILKNDIKYSYFTIKNWLTNIINILTDNDNKFKLINMNSFYINIEEDCYKKYIYYLENSKHEMEEEYYEKIIKMQNLEDEINVFLNIDTNILNKFKKNKNKNNTIISKEPFDKNSSIIFRPSKKLWIKSPLQNNIILFNKSFNCIKWHLNHIKVEVTLILEEVKTKNKYKHIIKEKDFKNILLREYDEKTVNYYLYESTF